MKRYDPPLIKLIFNLTGSSRKLFLHPTSKVNPKIYYQLLLKD